MSGKKIIFGSFIFVVSVTLLNLFPKMNKKASGGLSVGQGVSDNNINIIKTSNIEDVKQMESPTKDESEFVEESIAEQKKDTPIDESKKENKLSNNNMTSNKIITSNKTSNVTSNKTNESTSNKTVAQPNNSKTTTTSNKTPLDSKYDVYTEKYTKPTDYKYGIKIIHAYVATYYVYPDGSKKLVSNTENKSLQKYDYSGYNAKPTDLVSEAKTVYSKYKSQIMSEIEYVNEYRKNAGLNSLSYDEDLTLYASVKALDMYYGNYFAHESKTGAKWGYIGKELNINSYAENIAKGPTSAEKVTILWYESPGHKANMMNKSYTKIGVGYIDGIWVQEFK